MQIILGLLTLSVLAVAVWNVIEIAYHTIMLVLCVIGYVLLTVCEVIQFGFVWTLLKPSKWLFRQLHK